MTKPKLSWFPVSLLENVLVHKTVTPEDWLRKAREFGLDAVVMYYQFLGRQDLAYVEKLARTVRDLDLEVSMLACSPDYANPDPEVRRQQKSMMEMHVENAHLLGAPMVRVTAGPRNMEVDDEEGLRWVVDSIMELEGLASNLQVKIAIENHYRDRFAWDLPDFAARPNVFAKLYEELCDTPIIINYDCASPVMLPDDRLGLLRLVLKDVAHVCAGDYRDRTSEFTVAGDGIVSFDEIFGMLAANGYSGRIAVADGGADGDECIRRSIKFLQSKIDRYWPD